MYVYTALYQDGRIEVLDTPKKKWKGEKIWEYLGGYMEMIPKDYYPTKMNGTVLGESEARFKPQNHRNPHMQVIHDMFTGRDWDCVGNLLLEQTERQNKIWLESQK